MEDCFCWITLHVTFSMKELKAFLSFCEGCEIDIHLFFDKAGEPILMAPKFGLDDGSGSSFDATLVLATMLISQLHEGNPSVPPQAATTMHGSQGQQDRSRANVSDHPSDHTRIWSDLSVSAARSSDNVEERQAQGKQSLDASEQRDIERLRMVQIANNAAAREKDTSDPPAQKDNFEAAAAQDRSEVNGHGGHGFSQHHPSNWVDADEDDEDDGEDNELCVQSTPPYYE